MPKKIIFQDLPRTSTGKIQKYNLRKVAIENNAKAYLLATPDVRVIESVKIHL